MRFARLSVFTLLPILCVAAMASAQNTAESKPAPNVIVVHSYGPDYIWTQAISQGIQEALRGVKTTVETLYLDAKRDHDPESLRGKAQAFLARIEATAPQVVIAADDAAQAQLAAPYLKGRASPQVIFCGVNAPPSLYGFPAPNVSGVRERWHLREGFALLKKISPSSDTVALLLDDTESAGYIADDLQAELKQGGPFALKLVSVEKIRTFQQWQRRVKHHQTRTKALALGMYHALRDEATGRVVPTATVIAWTNSVNRLPTLGFADYAVGDGLLCGVLESGREQGLLAGSMARQVLEKKIAAGSLPVRTNQKGIVFVNLKTAERLGLSIPYEIINAAGVVIK
ncbi:MAG TPA: ABC transporter substrate binding protein [Humidesulfovibrio sp.]|uniref:ABC transporter substrate-binding protein n=1 Tax=Humidesulfovibrio sp. TaxID=2910988 RepID=UPI002C5FF1FB|nr:ABC transporter substrate binding protein [Humidesulfovibrio sp.]HWR04099.1 ABC transporter substrate binding protein [Humidesulfovibrio sp.]